MPRSGHEVNLCASWGDQLQSRLQQLFEELSIPPELVLARGLPLCMEAESLVVVEVDKEGREHRLIPAAADAWRRLRAKALSDGVALMIASAYRSIDRQADIIRNKLDRGLTIEAILVSSAPPGYSEHHSGRAVDVVSSDSPPLEPDFDQTEAFSWLSEHADTFHYKLSFPEGNRFGYMYEPWHWCFRDIE